jgi:hypothetical protein
MKFSSLCPPALFGAVIGVLAAPLGAQTYNGPGGVIPSAGSGGGTYDATLPCTTVPANFFTSTILVPVPVCTVDQIQLDNWTHTWVGDLQIVLVDPGGTGHNIMVRPGFNSAGAFGNSGDRLGGTYKFVKVGGLPVPHAAATNMLAGTYNEDFGDPNIGAFPPGGLWLAGNTIADGTNPLLTVNNGMGSVVCPPPFAPGAWELRIYDWAGGDTGAISGWSISVNGNKPPPPVIYCTSKVSCLGCRPMIGSDWPIGVPSATKGFGFTVTCINALNNKAGLLFYSVAGPNATAFQCGTLCVLAPIRRTPAQQSGGTPPPTNDCTGVWALDMNCFAVGNCGGVPLPALTVMGTQVWCQWWGRDPFCAPPCNTQLSDGLTYIIGT